MTNRDIPTPFRFSDITAAIGLLTRLPVRVDADRASARGAAAAWAYPLAGLVVGTVASLVGWAAMAMNLPASAVALLIVTAQIVLTGGLHQDGLADTADGFWGGWDAENRMHIMKDSAIGTYGVLALVTITGLQWAALTALVGAVPFAGLIIVIAMVSRASMVSLMHLMPNARQGGLSRAVGRPGRATTTMATTIAMIGAIVLTGAMVIPLVIITTLVAATCGLIAWRKIKGQTGDVLGATQQITETAMLLAAAALLAV